MKLYTLNDLIDLVQSLKDYTNESHNILGHDERDAKEFVDIFLKDRTPIELPSDEEIESKSSRVNPYMDDLEKVYNEAFLFCAKWMKGQILKQNK